MLASPTTINPCAHPTRRTPVESVNLKAFSTSLVYVALIALIYYGQKVVLLTTASSIDDPKDAASWAVANRK